ncbi:ATP binding microtubule motor family protein [Corchorus olitorius]|uniref:ATP binding microtubule motor family protein n=1 Tax=Corchorus olitorius TaxID=93759 RepID=A0A1R3GN83_9ROSI|nr:ATP binding microtubule motor family protein [Corchorus olitorius]
MGLNQGRKARVIAKIKGFTDLEPETADEASRRWISVHKPNGDDSETVTISFGHQSASLPCLLCLRCMRDTCIPEEKMLKDPRRLYAPGRLYYIVERKPFRSSLA